MVEVEEEKRSNNLLITPFEEFEDFDGKRIKIMRIIERYDRVPITAGYRKLVIIRNNNRSVLDSAVIRALDYARACGIGVMVANREVSADIIRGVYNLNGIRFVEV